MQTQPYRDLTTEEISEFRSSGVACLRQVVDPGWLPRIVQAANENLASPGRWALDLTRKENKGRFYNDRMLFRSVPFFRDYVFESGVGALAGQAMDASEIRIFFDHLFVKEPETSEVFFWQSGSSLLALQERQDLFDLVGGDRLQPRNQRSRVRSRLTSLGQVA